MLLLYVDRSVEEQSAASAPVFVLVSMFVTTARAFSCGIDAPARSSGAIVQRKVRGLPVRFVDRTRSLVFLSNPQAIKASITRLEWVPRQPGHLRITPLTDTCTLHPSATGVPWSFAYRRKCSATEVTKGSKVEAFSFASIASTSAVLNRLRSTPFARSWPCFSASHATSRRVSLSTFLVPASRSAFTSTEVVAPVA